MDGPTDRTAHIPASTTTHGPVNATADTTVNGAKGRTPVQKASNPLGHGPPADLCAADQTAMATSERPPVCATTVRSALPPGTSARTVQVPSAA